MIFDRAKGDNIILYYTKETTGDTDRILNSDIPMYFNWTIEHIIPAVGLREIFIA